MNSQSCSAFGDRPRFTLILSCRPPSVARSRSPRSGTYALFPRSLGVEIGGFTTGRCLNNRPKKEYKSQKSSGSSDLQMQFLRPEKRNVAYYNTFLGRACCLLYSEHGQVTLRRCVDRRPEKDLLASYRERKASHSFAFMLPSQPIFQGAQLM